MRVVNNALPWVIVLKRAIVIGSGIAGLSSALRLKSKGFSVKVFESQPYAGGKLHVIEQDGYRFDMGPSLFTMPHLVDELFELFGDNPSEYFNYVQKEVICNYFWEDGTRFQAKADQEEFIREAAKIFGEKAERIRSYLHKNGRKFELTRPIFLEKSLHKAGTYFNGKTLKALAQSWNLDLMNTLDQVNQSNFTSPHLIQLFNRYATYNGSSPYKTPGIMSMIPHLEMKGGTYFPKKGMHDISQSLYRFGKKKGIEFHLNEGVHSIRHDQGKAIGITTAKDNYDADLIVANADIYSTYHKLITDLPKPKKILEQERSSSALIFYWGLNKTFHELDLHNILFSDDYEREFDALFNRHELIDDPTIYINITSKEKPDDAPPNCENWFVMINAPENDGQDWASLIKKSRGNIISKLNRILRTDIEKHIQTEAILDPIKIENVTGSYKGSLYGTSSNGKFAAFLRHPNFSSRLKNLYFVGGSVHPGGGIPLCLLSARIATDMID